MVNYVCMYVCITADEIFFTSDRNRPTVHGIVKTLKKTLKALQM